MKAYFINPVVRSITRICHDASDYRNIDKAIGCEYFTAVDLCRNTCDAVYVDDEGLINGRRDTHGEFWLTVQTPRGPYTHQLMGCGLVLGCDPEGDTCAAEIQLHELEAMISFDRPEGWVDVKPGFKFMSLD